MSGGVRRLRYSPDEGGGFKAFRYPLLPCLQPTMIASRPA